MLPVHKLLCILKHTYIRVYSFKMPKNTQKVSNDLLKGEFGVNILFNKFDLPTTAKIRTMFLKSSQFTANLSTQINLGLHFVYI